MNVSMADTFNLGWKLAAVLRGQANETLLDTYSEERRAKAKELIDFDKDMARLFSAKPKDAAEADQFQQYFKKHGRYTAGVETRYVPSMLVGDSGHQKLATGYPVGMRFHSAPVIRLADARPTELGHMLKADGRWRLIGRFGSYSSPVTSFGVLCTSFGMPLSSFCSSLVLTFVRFGVSWDALGTPLDSLGSLWVILGSLVGPF